MKKQKPLTLCEVFSQEKIPTMKGTNMNTTTQQTTLQFFNQDDLAAAMPSLDGFEPSEMRQFRAEVTEVINVLQNMRSYAEAREMAGDARLRGKVDLAQRFESAAETVYKRLPEWAKW